MCSEPVISARHLSKHYHLYASPRDRLKQFLWRGRKRFFHEVHALRDISFDVASGESVGIVGMNGSGKSTLLQIICGTLTPSSGEAQVKGRISALLELGTGFNPQFTGRENVFLNGTILGMSREEIAGKFDSIAEFAGIGEFIEHPVATYSSGMVVRLAFAVATATEPSVLVVDEALAVGDEAFQRKCYARIAALKERGCTLLFVSHSARTIVEICDRAILLDRGELLIDGSPKTVMALYHSLLYALPARRGETRQRILALGGEALSTLREEPAAVAMGGPAREPESKLSFASNGAEIGAVSLATEDGAPVSLLVSRQRYEVNFDVAFTQAARDVHFAMLIKTPTDIRIGGGVTAADILPEATAGATYRVRFVFTCLLLPGPYYINCRCSGVLGENGEEELLHRVIDAASFRVQATTRSTGGGMVDLLVESAVEPVRERQVI